MASQKNVHCKKKVKIFVQNTYSTTLHLDQYYSNYIYSITIVLYFAKTVFHH